MTRPARGVLARLGDAPFNTAGWCADAPHALTLRAVERGEPNGGQPHHATLTPRLPDTSGL